MIKNIGEDPSELRTPNCCIRIETERLILRSVVRSEDEQRIFEIKSNSNVAKYQLYDKMTSLKQTNVHFTFLYIASDIPSEATYGFNRKRVLAVTLKDSGLYIGNVGYYPDMSYNVPNIFYELDPAYWHNGYATEAARAMVKFIFEVVGALKVIADPFVPQTSSQALLTRLGFKFKKEFKNHVVVYPWKQRLYELERKDWALANNIDESTLPSTRYPAGKCSWCMNPQVEAKSVCGKCKNENYCSRECQLAHWKDSHKKSCRA